MAKAWWVGFRLLSITPEIPARSNAMADRTFASSAANACYPPDIFRPVVVRDNACWAVPPALRCQVAFDRQEEILVVPRPMAETVFTQKRIEISLGVGQAVSHHLSELKDVFHLREVFHEFGVAGKAYTKLINGKAYVILKGRPGLRRIFKGTKYLEGNSKIVSFGVGKAGVLKSIKGGTVWSLVFVNAWDIAEFFIKRDKSLIDLGVNMVSDSAKIVLASAISGGLVIGGMALASVSLPVVVPLAAALVLGIAVGALLDKADEKWKITEAFRGWAHQTVRDIQQWASRTANQVQDRLEAGQRILREVGDTVVAAGAAARQVARQFREWQRWFDDLRYGIPHL
jgi:hypothetical protein